MSAGIASSCVTRRPGSCSRRMTARIWRVLSSTPSRTRMTGRASACWRASSWRPNGPGSTASHTIATPMPMPSWPPAGHCEMAKPELLFLTQRIPYPPIKGEKIRPLQILRHLAKSYLVHLGCLIDDPDDWRHVSIVRELCGKTYFAKLNPRVAKLACLRGLLTGEPLSKVYFRDRGLAAWVNTVLAERRPERAFICSSAMAQYLLDGPRLPARTVMDFADVDADK